MMQMLVSFYLAEKGKSFIFHQKTETLAFFEEVLFTCEKKTMADAYKVANLNVNDPGANINILRNPPIAILFFKNNFVLITIKNYFITEIFYYKRFCVAAFQFQ